MRKFLSLLVVAIVAGTAVLFSNYKSLNSETPVVQEATRTNETFVSETKAFSDKKVSVKELDLSKGTVVLFNTEVTAESANSAIEQIRQANKSKPGKPIYLLLDSPGGSVLDGARVISAMQASKSPVNTVCIQLCASMAAMMLEYGNERYAVDRAIVMFHPASVGVQYQGELDKMVSRFAFLKRYVDKMDHYTAQRSGQTYEAHKAKSSQELWIDAEDALNDHYIDKIVKIDMESRYQAALGENKMRENFKFEW